MLFIFRKPGLRVVFEGGFSNGITPDTATPNLPRTFFEIVRAGGWAGYFEVQQRQES